MQATEPPPVPRRHDPVRVACGRYFTGAAAPLAAPSPDDETAAHCTSHG